MTSVPVVSPELSLVDPDLARAAREALHEPGQFVPAWREVPKPLPRLADPAPVPVPVPVPRVLRPGRRRRRAALLAAGAGVAVFGAVTGLNHPLRHQTAGGAEPAAALHDRALQQAQAARRYEWPVVPGATSYRVELRRGDSLIYAAARQTATTALPAGLALRPGTYHWTVTPVLPHAETRPVVEETFVVSAS